MPMISTGCALTPPSSWPADDCRIADWICVRSRPCPAGRNAPNLREVIRLMGVMIDLYCASYATPPVAVTLDIDDTLDVVHVFNAHYDERCFLPIHVYDVATSRPLAVLLRSPRRRPVRRSLAICAGSYAASAGTGRLPESPCVAIVTTAARK